MAECLGFNSIADESGLCSADSPLEVLACLAALVMCYIVQPYSDRLTRSPVLHYRQLCALGFYCISEMVMYVGKELRTGQVTAAGKGARF
jgi:hypothetical protein